MYMHYSVVIIATVLCGMLCGEYTMYMHCSVVIIATVLCGNISMLIIYCNSNGSKETLQ